MHTVFSLATLTGASMLSLSFMQAHAAGLSDGSKPFDQYHWVTTHNSYEKINQNLKEMPQQLSDGVRGFMLDLYTDHKQKGFNRIIVCHKSLACYGPWGNHLKNEFIPFLKANPAEVVTLFLESYVTRDDLQQVFASVPELAEQWPGKQASAGTGCF
ncbi:MULTISPECIES: hypothetical protein [Pseudomonas syringae group]|uniref:Phosphatidylinositol diacylglycerol-lyase n=1 Tax=Pseudomonas syringae pv. ribicola TaxID=55398 RepID=A0A0N8SNI3_PSESI|nr:MULTISPECIES: hypothetical protein [Pseudomonas syringae group]EKN46600.1 hypothetical protein AAI_10761 [Pseudomonas viridiflava UASWS0038]KPL62152.1 hypothetical protein PVFL_23705 [Pseudomonas viridiflava]KPY43672.1 Uncharacterized protein ALO47_02730 [Pseudomonas syringae pv. ribicola]KPZ24801.1 Uncharacterized protein ALO56_04141 [Pseudomonas viridiflava]OAG91034.1 hypothetical protein AO065_15505 [Pseudomonas viridiflava]